MNASAQTITRDSNTSFYYSFSFLPKHKREAIHTVYAFCRYTDDIVDEDDTDRVKPARLRRWRMELRPRPPGRFNLSPPQPAQHEQPAGLPSPWIISMIFSGGWKWTSREPGIRRSTS